MGAASAALMAGWAFKHCVQGLRPGASQGLIHLTMVQLAAYGWSGPWPSHLISPRETWRPLSRGSPGLPIVQRRSKQHWSPAPPTTRPGKRFCVRESRRSVLSLPLATLICDACLACWGRNLLFIPSLVSDEARSPWHTASDRVAFESATGRGSEIIESNFNPC